MPSMPMIVVEPPTKPTTLSGAAFDRPPTVQHAGRGRTVLVAALAAGVIGAAVIVLALRGSHDSKATPAAAEPAPVVAAPEPSPAVAAAPVATPPLATPPVAAPNPDAVPPAPSEPAVATVELSITTAPPGAIVLRDATQLGVTPFHGTLPRGEAPVKLTLRKSGHKDKLLTVVPTAALDENVKLEPKSRSTQSTNRDQSVNPF
jgi:hypothetical protein